MKSGSCEEEGTCTRMDDETPPPLHWTTHDDILLKNAIEAGASLESLAKGAVQFSRRFNFQELHDRWRSILYGIRASEEASVCMIEFERSAVMTQSKNSKFESVKELVSSSGKRRAESIRKCYYSRRKRICNAPFEMMGMNILTVPGKTNPGHGNEFSSAEYGISNPAANNLGIQETDFDIGHPSFSEFGTHAASASASASAPAPAPAAAESIGNGIMPSFTTVQNHAPEPQLGRENVSHSLSFPYQGNVSPVGDCGQIPLLDQSRQLPPSNIFGTEGIENKENACLEFGDSQFHGFGCPSPLPQMPIWSTSPEIASAGLSIQSGENDRPDGGAFIISKVNDVNKTNGLTCDVTGPISHLEAAHSCDSISTEEYLAELSHTLFDFSNEEELLLMDTDGKEPIDKSYLDNFSSLLLESPNRSELPTADADAIVVAPDRHFVQTSGTLSGVVDNVALQHGHRHKISEPQIEASVSSAKNVGPEYRNGVICCVLNTEHPDIPDNDDVFLPFRCPSPFCSSGVHWRLHDPDYQVSSSSLDFSSSRKTNAGPSVLQNNHKNVIPSSCSMGSSQLSDANPVVDQGLKFELPKSNVHHAAPRNVRNCEFRNRINSANLATSGGANMDIERGKGVDYKPRGPSAGKNSPGFNILPSLQKNIGSSMSELDAKPEIPGDRQSKIDSTHQKANIGDPADKPLTSDHEDLWSEDDFDIPDFSDVEQMILDMDLSPDEYDIYTNPEVQRYQNEESKKTIIRLEQAANACAQRAIAAQGAFAVLYGRYSKYYIKKPEVLIGRATDDIKVDIDLGRERNGGKVSRRQANVKVDESGMFHLKNLGKSPIYVGGKEVASGFSVNLTSGCLIQIRSLSYLFEANQARIKQYLNSMSNSSTEDCKPLLKN